jgi:hypothetical protein
MRDDLDEKRREILAAMDYAVAEADRAAAEDLLEIYREDRLGLTLLHAFYSRLPEAREAWVREIRLVNRHRGIFLLLAETAAESYFYLVSSEGVEFQGSLRDRYLAAELLDFFGYESEEAFAQVCAGAGDLPVYEPLQMDADICPACHAVAGEVHELGCPVEICPWCGGQLIHCDCRFERLGLDALTSEEDLLRFEAMLEEQGRITYSPEQRPAFLDDDGPPVMFD